MEAPAAEKIHKIPVKERPNRVVHIPTQEREWRQRVVQEVRKIPEVGPSFETEHTTPAASGPVPESKALEGAERVGAEPEFPVSIADAKHHIETLAVPVLGEEPGTYDRSIPGTKGVAKSKERARKLLKKAA